MKPQLLVFASLFSAALLPAPAAARNDWVIKDVFGSERCPTSNGEEIVVCRRLPESERFRIPKDLREAAKGEGPPGWAQRIQSLEYVGSGGTDSCTPTGEAGWTGCWSELMRNARADRKQRKKDELTLP